MLRDLCATSRALCVNFRISASPPNLFPEILLPMNPKKLLLAAVLAVALSTSAFAQQAKGPLSWVFAKSVTTKLAVEVPPSVGAVNVLSFYSGAKVVIDAEAPGGKVLVLDGTQTAPGTSLRALDPMPTIQIKLSFKPAPQGAERQTLLRLADYELRYGKDRNQLEFIVWYGQERKFVIVTAPVSSKGWNVATATFSGTKLTLAVGKVVNTMDMPAGEVVFASAASVRVGLATDRPFSGSLAELSIGTP